MEEIRRKNIYGQSSQGSVGGRGNGGGRDDSSASNTTTTIHW